MSLAVSAAASLDEAVVERQIVSNAVAPSGTSAPEVRVVVEDPLVDVAEDELAFLGAEDRHRYDADVAVVRFGLVVWWLMMRLEQVPISCKIPIPVSKCLWHC